MAQIAAPAAAEHDLADRCRAAAKDSPTGPHITRAYNSIYAIDHDGSILSVYDKLHLVPFGEYLPFQQVMERLGFIQLTMLRGGYIPGLRRKTMELPHTPPVLPLICYEAIFPGDIVPPR